MKARRCEGWVIKNSYGSLLLWSAGWRRKDVLNKAGKSLRILRIEGCEVVKIRVLELAEK